MNVIRRGELPPGDALPVPGDVFEGKCRRCAAVVQFRRDEATSWSHDRSGNRLGISCPTCKQTISVDEKEANNLWKYVSHQCP